MNRFIAEHRGRFGVEPICHTLQVAPSTYYAARRRPPCARLVRDQRLAAQTQQVHAAHFGVYGVRKVWRQLQREGVAAAPVHGSTVDAHAGPPGAVRGRRHRTTIADQAVPCPADLVQRDFHAAAPNRLWVADLTYVRTWSGFVYVAFVIDAYSRAIVGWQVASSLHADLVLTALEHALWARKGPFAGLVHHSDRGVQYRLSGTPSAW